MEYLVVVRRMPEVKVMRSVREDVGVSASKWLDESHVRMA